MGGQAGHTTDFLCRDRVQLATKKRSHTGTVVQSSEKMTIKVTGKTEYPELNKVLVLPGTKQKLTPIKKAKRRNELFYLMLSKFVLSF